jgi:hypothetical protein
MKYTGLYMLIGFAIGFSSTWSFFEVRVLRDFNNCCNSASAILRLLILWEMLSLELFGSTWRNNLGRFLYTDFIQGSDARRNLSLFKGSFISVKYIHIFWHIHFHSSWESVGFARKRYTAQFGGWVIAFGVVATRAD